MTSNGEVRTVSSTGAEKGVKPEAFDLLPSRPLRLLAQFYGTGTVDFSSAEGMSEVFNYVNEQLWSFWFGEDTDPDSGLPRPVAAAAGCFALVDLMSRPDMDDRPPNQRLVTVASMMTRHRYSGEETPDTRFDLIPYAPLVEVARHYHRGASKYARHNWAAGYEWSKPFAALLRHLWAFWNREDIDTETGSPHVTASAWHCLSLTEFLFTHRGFDDRALPGTKDTRMSLRQPELDAPVQPVAESLSQG
jgi:hypothetical protein